MYRRRSKTSTKLLKLVFDWLEFGIIVCNYHCTYEQLCATIIVHMSNTTFSADGTANTLHILEKTQVDLV